jgi:hypothetical protein
MIRIRSFAIAVAALVALGLAPLAHAQAIKDTTETGAVTGAITKLDAAAGMLTVKGPNDDGGSYQVDKYTGIMNGDKKIALEDLKPGWHVVVNYDTNEKGRIAKLIEVVDTP